MTTKDFHIKYPLRIRLLSSFLIFILAIFFFLLLFNNLAGPFFYKKSKEKLLKESYVEMTREIDRYSNNELSKEQLDDRLQKIINDHEIHAIVVDSDWSLVFVCDYNDRVLMDRLVSNVMGNTVINGPDPDIIVLEKNNNYILQKTVESEDSGDSYELWGTTPNGYTILCRFTSATIKNSVEVMNHVILLSGMIMLGGSVIAALILSKRITTPLRKLTEIASDISSFEFDTRYTDKDTSEIGFLGVTMNELSDKLEDNITKLKSANLELEKDIRNKENIQKQQKEFLSSISHELKTPIALISGYAEALKDGVAKDKESIEEYCEIIIDESEKMDKLIKQMLTINELESGRTDFSIERFSITELICSVLNANRIKFEKNNIRVLFDGQNEDITVWGDMLKVEQVLTNYITNAINYCSGEKKIKVDIEQKDKTSRIHVWNSGDNIPEEDINEIWNKFYKVDKARTREYGGNGIGLSIVKSICELHGQKYGVENTPGGVDFWFELDSDRGKV